MRVQIDAVLKADDENVSFSGKGIYDKKKELLTFKDKDAKITIFMKDNILIRETEEAILSYKFNKENKSRFEIFVKELNQTGMLMIETLNLKVEQNLFEVKYQLEGNQFSHHYIVNWRKL